MRRLVLALLSFLMLSALAACAAPSTTSQAALSLPQPGPGLGRVYVYRPGDIVGAWNQPTVLMNGRIVGQASPGKYFYVDVPPGNYIVQTVIDTSRQANFAIRPGEKRYVRMNNVFAGLVQVYPELVGEFEGVAGLQGLSYGG